MDEDVSTRSGRGATFRGEVRGQIQIAAIHDAWLIGGGPTTMTTVPPRIGDASAMKDSRTIIGYAFAFASVLAATGSGIIGIIFGIPMVFFAASRRPMTHAERRRFITNHVLLMILLVVGVFFFREVLMNWADFKQGFIEGMNAGRC